MASVLRKVMTAVSRPKILGIYLAWKLRCLFHIEPLLTIGGGGRISTQRRFNAYYGVHVQHPQESDFVAVKSLLTPRGVFVDVGANIGQMCVLASSTGGATRLLAFEPTHTLASAWHKNVARNRVPCATLIQAACASRSGTVRFVVSTPMHNRMLDIPETDDEYKNEIPYLQEVTCVTLDSACEAAGIDEIRLLKIDVEGAEFQVLRGAVKLLSRGAIKSIFMEFIPEYIKLMGDDHSERLRWLTGFGYHYASIDEKTGQFLPLTEQQVIDRQFAGLNIVARLKDL